MEKKIYDNNSYPLQDETEKIIKIGIEIHKILGAGFLEIVYKDAFEYEYRNQDILYEREKEYIIQYKSIILPHKFYADFVVFWQSNCRNKSKRRWYCRRRLCTNY
jgi:GxxExxY protein